MTEELPGGYHRDMSLAPAGTSVFWCSAPRPGQSRYSFLLNQPPARLIKSRPLPVRRLWFVTVHIHPSLQLFSFRITLACCSFFFLPVCHAVTIHGLRPSINPILIVLSHLHIGHQQANSSRVYRPTSRLVLEKP